MTKALIDIWDALEAQDERELPKTRNLKVRAPFGYIGGKYRSVDALRDILPYTPKYVEVFGGSGVVLLNREPVAFECYNDRYGGVVSFYQCIRDRDNLMRLKDLIDSTIYSRELFIEYRDTWKNVEDPVERAFRWYYHMASSFAQKGKHFGRGMEKSLSHIFASFPSFEFAHKRLRNVLIENLDWQQCINDFDSPETVFYCDPPYVKDEIWEQAYEHQFKNSDHIRLCDHAFKVKGYVAISGYKNKLYEKYPWTDIKTWEVSVSSKGQAFDANNNMEDKRDIMKRGYHTEYLYIKDFA